MFESNEIVNLVASAALFFYFIKLTKEGKCNQMPKEWMFGVLLLTVSNIFTVAEGVVFPVLFNSIEHLASVSASLIFLVGALKLKVS